MSTIKAGYRITVTSWENDADNYNTHTIDGLDEPTTKYHVELLRLIKGSHCNDKTVFGNLYEPRDSEVEAFEKAAIEVLAKHGKLEDDYEPLDIAVDILYDYTGCSEGYLTRVAEYISVEYVPQEIVIEDVSNKFGV
jgi:hypothetical protein